MARILLVDDDSLLRDALQQMLALDGHEVTEADDGQTALELVKQGHSPDLVITDILMPVMDGTQLIAELARLQPHCRVIAISGGRRSLPPQFSLGSAGAAGATVSLAKPFGRAALQDAVLQVLEG